LRSLAGKGRWPKLALSSDNFGACRERRRAEETPWPPAQGRRLGEKAQIDRELRNYLEFVGMLAALFGVDEK
jgi:hypothetical protein